MRKAILLALGLAASSFVIRRGRKINPISAVAVAGVLEEVARRLRNQALPDRGNKPSLWAGLPGLKRPNAKA
jgi:hypothetical protein